jgi:hypothetical protein
VIFQTALVTWRHRMTVNDELERLLKEADMACFKMGTAIRKSSWKYSSKL